jgi:DNA-binding MarR family transcriptional regulator
MGRGNAEKDESGRYQLADSVSHLLHRVEQVAADRFAERVGDSVSLRQFTVLAAIAASPGLSQSELGRIAGIDRSTLADMIARMEKRGWIDRTTSLLDARAQSVHLAPAGSETLNAVTAHARAADDAILDLLPRTKRKSLINILAKLDKLAAARAQKAEREARRKAKREARKKEPGQKKGKKKRKPRN